VTKGKRNRKRTKVKKGKECRHEEDEGDEEQ
jgi:hypothetical protein